jgi:hypothetical protein
VYIRIIKDPAWKEVSSNAFKSKFLKHNIPWVRDIASMKLNIAKLQEQQKTNRANKPTVVFKQYGFGDNDESDEDGVDFRKRQAQSEYQECRKYAVSVVGENFIAK